MIILYPVNGMQCQGERPCAAVRICDDENQIGEGAREVQARGSHRSTETCSPVFLQVIVSICLKVIFDTYWERHVFYLHE